MPQNVFKQTLKQGRLQIGLFVGPAGAYGTEILATAGFDWLLTDGEHAPNNPASVLAQFQASAAYPVRIAATDKAAGVFVTEPKLATSYRDCGASLLAVGGNTSLPRNAAVRLASSFRDGKAESGAAH